MTPTPQPIMVPQSWFEWIHTLYDPRRFILQRQHFGISIAVAAQTNGVTQAIACPEPFYCFAVRSKARVSAGANLHQYPAAGYKIGFKEANGNDWFSGQWWAELITGDVAAAFQTPYPDWDWPRPLAENQQITVTIDNGQSVAGDSLSVDVNLVGYVVRTYSVPQAAHAI